MLKIIFLLFLYVSLSLSYANIPLEGMVWNGTEEQQIQSDDIPLITGKSHQGRLYLGKVYLITLVRVYGACESNSSCELNVRSRDNDFTKSKNLSEYIVFKSELPVATNLLIFFFDSKDPKTSFRIDKLELVGLLYTTEANEMVTNEIVAKKDSNFNHTTVRADRSARTKVDNNRTSSPIIWMGLLVLTYAVLFYLYKKGSSITDEERNVEDEIKQNQLALKHVDSLLLRRKKLVQKSMEGPFGREVKNK